MESNFWSQDNFIKTFILHDNFTMMTCNVMTVMKKMMLTMMIPKRMMLPKKLMIEKRIGIHIVMYLLRRLRAPARTADSVSLKSLVL